MDSFYFILHANVCASKTSGLKTTSQTIEFMAFINDANCILLIPNNSKYSAHHLFFLIFIQLWLLKYLVFFLF